MLQNPEVAEADLWPEWENVGASWTYCDDMILVMLYKSLLSKVIIPSKLWLKNKQNFKKFLNKKKKKFGP